ncbi:MAG: hypothetical protein O4861_01655 [Trichodesmium sp. St16_bin4-tuft]|nr:hypothetical protein [Trichodesmium sp. St4_bin8_1]MDE5074390.1 hypothetical protein [Trichodesmium sp. St5_bin8]MDE5078379.1 hypothetical protein [Trichodesmium sp. St2_bin6]MDE5091073.1 hypothetical protein [Trichodesmium sp. St18_bin3_1_1]MDE5097112.1 hypothetical protein [Trichodesmium sp. St16_bin4-tuft]MDE5102600.1 hypothetical protein [Trichodesmium sp. St19_bin2]
MAIHRSHNSGVRSQELGDSSDRSTVLFFSTLASCPPQVHKN